MTRLIAVRANTFPLRGGAIVAVCLALVMMVGCQKGDSTKSKPQPAANSEKSEASPTATTTNDSPTIKSLTAREVLNRMIAAYRKASSYVDVGTVRFVAEADGKTIHDETDNFSMALVRPNKVHIRAYKAELVCDGKTLYAYRRDLPGQVLSRAAPEQLTMTNVQPDLVVNTGMMEGVAGGMPQIPLLFDDKAFDMFLRELGEPEMSEPGKIDGHDCYRLKFRPPNGEATFWIDQQSYVLRRIVLPTDALRQDMSQAGPIGSISVVADFTGAKFDSDVDPNAFGFEIPKDVKLVEFLTPPHMGQLLTQKVPDFRFSDLAGNPVTPATIAGKTTVLMFWTVRYEACRKALKGLDEVYQKYKDDPKVAIYAVCVDPSQLNNADLEKGIADLGVHVPILRDFDASGTVFNLGEPPTTFIINDKGIVQHCEGGLNPKYAESLQAKLSQVLTGQDIFEEPLKQYHEQVEELRKFAKSTEAVQPEPQPGDAIVAKDVRIPETKTAKNSEPSTFKLASLWKCTDVKMPGNIVVVGDKKGSERLLVVENGNSIAEVGFDGKLLALHKLDLAANEAVSSLRTAVGADGRRYVVAFLPTQQRCHLIDENWNLVVSYPEDALKNPHPGIADVLLGDLNGDGTLKMYVSFWGVVGVQGVSLDGKRLWNNRTDVSNVGCIAIGAVDGRRELYCTNNPGNIVVLDALGERRGAIGVANRRLRWIADADLRGDGRPLWCGLASERIGEITAVGFSPAGEELWSYPLPVGIPPQPIEPIVPGRITRNGAGQWLLPGPDGSIHIISADGEPLDKFNYGAVLNGLATLDLNGQPVLVVATHGGVEAWKVH